MKKWIYVILYLVIGLTAILNAGFANDSLLNKVLSSKTTIDKMKGVSWVGNDSVPDTFFDPLKKNNVNWMVQTPFGWQEGFNSPSVVLSTSSKYYWGERDQGIIHTTHLAKTRNIKTILKPHIWMRSRDGKWRSDISMDNEEDWDKWFASYTVFIMHYAVLAEQLDIEVLCIGTELYLTTVNHEAEWREIIRSVKQVYSGKLIYAGNWYKEYEEIAFWDELDYIGIQAYFPLVDFEHPEVDALKKGWLSHVPRIKAIGEKYKKPVIFTEVGYRSMPNAGIEPWLWPKRKSYELEPVSFETQTNCYEAMFQTFWHEPWFGGVFIWKWFPDNDKVREGHHGFSPQNKPAEEVLAKWFRK